MHCDLHSNLHPTRDRHTGTFHVLCTLHVESKVLTVVTVAYDGTECGRNVPVFRRILLPLRTLVYF